MMNHLLAKGVNQEKILFFPNWVDIDFITLDFVGREYRDEWGFSAAQRLVLYSGNLGKKQGIELVLDAAEFFSFDASIQFVIVGQGAQRKVLEQKARDKLLDNVHFKDLVPYEELPALLAMADIHLVVQKKGAADVVLPSKLSSILSAGGHALITAEKETELGKLVEKYPGIAQRVEPENLDAFVQGLQCLLEKDVTLANSVARDYAVNQLGRDAILSRFYRELQELSSLTSASTGV
jgi:colanic acid biosynthesis glycosyl transferase WcaI